MTDIENTVRQMLLDLQDVEYKKFHAKLMPTVDEKRIIGVRVPALRKLSAEINKYPIGTDFIKILPHKYYEEDNLHAFLVEKIKDFDSALAETQRLLPYIDNWATCDMFSPKVFAKHTDAIYEKSLEWIKSDRTYTVRYGIGMLMRYFLDDRFSPEVLKIVGEIKSDEYYINMMIAWFFATAIAKQYDATIGYIENKILPPWVHNKAIQKAVESKRIDKETKQYLKSLK